MSRIIHKGYFKEMFRQLMVIGIVSAGILMIGNLTSILQHFIQNVVMLMPSAEEMASPLKIYVYVAGVILTFAAFGWLNKRARCDFYHSIPVSRTQMFFSTVLAEVCWMFIGILAYSLVFVIRSIAFGAPFNYFLFLCVVVNMLIASVEVTAAVSLACAISGNRFVNIVAAVVILFMPRLLLSCLSWFSIINDPQLVPGAMSIFFDPSYNIIAVPYAFNAMYNVPVNYANGWAMLYTCAYTAGLTALGWLAFKKRRSEMAGQATAHPVIQAVIRISLGIPLLLVVSLLLLETEMEGFALFIAPVLVIISFVIYSLYELISTKSALKMAKAMPLFLVCIAVSAAYVFLPKLIGSGDRNAKLTADDIVGYTCLNYSEGDYFETMLLGSGFDSTYADVMLPEYTFTDAQSREIIAGAYHRESGYPMTVRIKRNSGHDITRILHFTDIEERTLEMLRDENEAYKAEAHSFPKGSRFYSCSDLSRSSSAELAKVFEEEFNALSDAEKDVITNSLLNYEGVGPNITLAGCIGAKNYRNDFDLTELTPKSLSMYLKKVNENSGNKALNTLREIENWFNNGGEMREFSINISGKAEGYINSWNMVYSDFYDYSTKPEEYTKTPAQTDPDYLEIVSMLANAPLTDDVNDYVYVTVSGDMINVMGLLQGNIGSANGFSMAVKLTPEQISELNRLIPRLSRW